jgi:PhnB protein
MLLTHIYFNGQCRTAIELYKKAFDAQVQSIIPNPERDELIIHAEVLIQNQLLYLNDFGGSDVNSVSGGYQLCIIFDSEEDLKEAYAIMETGSKTVLPMQPTDYSSCVVRFIDQFDVRWAFMV